jgi:CRP-like cAMP-binding protein
MSSDAVAARNLTADKIKVLKLTPSFEHLSSDQLREIAALATPCHFKKGQFIFHEGDPPDFFYVVQKGRVKLYKITASGKIYIASVVIRGYSLIASALFRGDSYFMSAQAMDQTSVLRVNREAYLSFVNRYPSVAMKIISILTKRMEGDLERIVDLIGERVDQRLYNVLLTLSERFGTTLNFTCRELAELAGTTTETAIRVFGKLRDRDILSSRRGKLLILDMAKLKELSHGRYHI